MIKRDKNDTGSTLVATLILVLALFGLSAAGLTAAAANVQISGNYHTGTQAFLAAETGVLHSVATLNGLGGIVRFDNEAVTPWATVFNTSAKTMPGYGAIAYSVTASSVASDPLNRMSVTSTGTAPRSSLRGIEALLKLDGAFSPGAVYLPGAAVNTTFDGNKFLVDGDDHLLNGGHNPPPPLGDGEDRPGIALRNKANVAPVISTLSGGQYDNVEGIGGSPSVLPASGPTAARITNEISTDILATAGVVTNPKINGHDTFGTVVPLVPQITHFTGNVTLNGTVEGAGILIVDQGLTVNGDLNFVGLIIVRGTTEFAKVAGDSTIIGALWTTDLNLKVAGSASVTYSSEALELMNATFGGNLLPQDVAVAAWKET